MSIIEKFEELKLHNEKKEKSLNKGTGDIYFEEGAKLYKDRVFPEDFDFELEEVIYNDATKGDFSKVINKDYTFELINGGLLVESLIVDSKFGGPNSEDNKVFLTKEAIKNKKAMEDKIEKMLKEGKKIIMKHEMDCTSNSIVPLEIKYIFSGDENFEEIIKVWSLK